MNLIPDKSPATGSYWCTWDTQWNVLKERLPAGSPIPTRDAMNEEFLFSPEGVLNSFEGMRGDMIVVLDDGWDVPYGAADSRLFGSLAADPERFPSLHGTPAERLRQLSDRVRALGYRGLGLWVPAQLPTLVDGKELSLTMDEERAGWEERARWCHEAGVMYWKVDWGRGAADGNYRRMMTECVRKYAPALKIEHALVRQPLFEPEKPEQEMHAWREKYLREVLPVSDYLRTYDVAPEFRYASTLHRAAFCLRAAAEMSGECAVLNVEDTALIGAALGCSLGVMRHPREERMQKLTYDYRPLSETLCALRWQRMAPPFAANRGKTLISEETLRDEWHYPVRDASLWPCVSDVTEMHSAPAGIARNLPLPEVRAEGERPFVAASVHPETGALCVAAIPRTLPGALERTPSAEIRVRETQIDAPVGLFGRFARMTVEFDRSVEGRRVWAQSLAGDAAENVTGEVELRGNTLSIAGATAARVAGAAENELPAIVLKLI